MFAAGSYDPPMGTLEAVISGGDLGILKNPALAAELTAWPSLVRHLKDEERALFDYTRREILPYLGRAGVRVADLVWFREGYEVYDYPIDPQHTDGYLLLPDAEWESIVTNRWWSYRDATDKAQPIRESIERIQVMLETELGGA
jgi:hypothetical protein